MKSRKKSFKIFSCYPFEIKGISTEKFNDLTNKSNAKILLEILTEYISGRTYDELLVLLEKRTGKKYPRHGFNPSLRKNKRDS